MKFSQVLSPNAPLFWRGLLVLLALLTLSVLIYVTPGQTQMLGFTAISLTVIGAAFFIGNKFAQSRGSEIESGSQHASEDLNIVRNNFLATMSHEIRTPLNGIIGMSELLRQEELKGDQQQYVNAIVQSGRTLMGTINEILDYAKLQAGELELDLAPVSLEECVESVLHQFANAAHSKDLELGSFIDPATPGYVKGDWAQLRRILVCLVDNAIKFTDHGGVSVSIGVAEKGDDCPLISIEVNDSGIGISKEDQERIFDGFEQLDQGATRRFGGSGLGLAICRQLCVLMKGKISLHSELGQGSCFRLLLPFTPEDMPRNQEVGSIAISMLQNADVLIVDDNAINRTILERNLEVFGASCTSLESAEEALDILSTRCSEQLFKIAIIDHMMPGMDGERLARILNSDPKYASMTMIISSSSGFAATDSQARVLGFEAALPKPISRNGICQCLNRLFGGKTQQEIESKAVDQPTSGPTKILIAEDNAVNQALMKAILGGRGFDFEIAENGQVAVEKVRSQHFDLVLMDVQMPTMDGIEATRQIRSLGTPFQDLPIIAVTANVMVGDKQRCLQAGMNDYLPKPVSVPALMDKIDFWCGSGNSTDSIRVQQDTKSEQRVEVSLEDQKNPVPQVQVKK